MNTIESPILSLDRSELYPTSYLDSRRKLFVCKNELSALFDLNDAERICFYSSTRETSDTYEAEIFPGTHNLLVKPLYTLIYRRFGKWLEKQIAAGRPHIGVRIVK